MKVLVLYYSKTGHTLEAVNPMVEGIKSAGSEVTVVTTKEFKSSMIEDHDALIVGSPCWGGVIAKDAAAKPIVKMLQELPEECLKHKKCGGFAVHAFAGGKNTLAHIRKLLSSKGCDNYKDSPVGKAGTAGSVTKGKSLSGADEDSFKAFGAAFVC
jgi:flavodoxin